MVHIWRRNLLKSEEIVKKVGGFQKSNGNKAMLTCYISAKTQKLKSLIVNTFSKVDFKKFKNTILKLSRKGKIFK